LECVNTDPVIPEIAEPELRRLAAVIRAIPQWEPDPAWIRRSKARLLDTMPADEKENSGR